MPYNNNRDFHNKNQGNPNAEGNSPRKMPADIIGNDGFYDKDGNPKKGLFDGIAQDLAKNMGRNAISTSQFRRIFDEVKRYERLIAKEDFGKYHPYILMIKSKTRYAVARATKNQKDFIVNAYEYFYEFIKYGLSRINNEKDYRVFLALFEAVYGFIYENLSTRN